MAEYGITLNTLICEYTKSELQCLYIEAKKREVEKLKADIKIMRAGIVEALTGKDVLEMSGEDNDDKDEEEISVLTEAGFSVG
ncbi:hypothetical protein [Anaeromicrobium sediminis]|uniref:Uncharacterized protein n=1 Tax=Anaeromicrobium sediminis TaxID=1478221 RepID=A0A267MQY4_9FIRM|nr:hypothetical protein [Anaeromicrobium sediminis]PAB61318.1 hypothetical protein CCE28_02480 [Anaeromicrobium sediminis]